MMDTLRGETFADFVAMLSEQLSCEQTNTALLDALARKHEEQKVEGVPLDVIERFREQELSHVRLLERAIRFLGGKPASPAEPLLLAFEPFRKIVQDSTLAFPSALEAITIAEQWDNLGWEILISLAEKNRLDWLAWEFRGALAEEQEHVRQFREWLGLLPAGDASQIHRRSA